MNFKKKVLTCAVGTALGVSVTAAQALSVTSWTLEDYNSDGLQSDFNFVSAPSGSSGNIFGSLGENGCLNASDGDNCDPINMVGQAGQTVDTFTTGFNFGGGGDFQPMILDSYAGGATTGSVNATIDTVNPLSGQSLQFSALDFAGIYQGTSTFLLGPDHLQNCTGEPAGGLGGTCGTVSSAGSNPGLSNPLGYNVSAISDLGGGDYGVVVEWAKTIAGSGTTFDGNEAHWRVEGVLHTAVPVPAAVWLFGSGLLGLVGVARRKKVTQ